jgi:hypothetical protein
MVGRTAGRSTVNRDLIGERGQQYALLALTEPVGKAESLFRPRFLGDKYPTIDFFVELVDAPVIFTPFFFVQVKATQAGYTQGGQLRVQVAADTMDSLIAYPVPTYIIGVDNGGGGLSYIVAALPGGPTHYPSLPTTHRLNGRTLRQLFNEILGFWRQHAATFTTSRFV